MGWLKENWFKLFLTVVILILSAEIFFVLYPYMVEGYQLFEYYTPQELFFSEKSSGSEPIKAINPFGN